jgi:uncharacterized protein
LRPERKRRVCIDPEAVVFKPRGTPFKQLEKIDLTLDELEAIRLCYLDGLYQEDAAKEMDISRQTLGRILISANQKIADFIVNGKALFIGGGSVYRGKTRGSKSFCPSREQKRQRHLTNRK